MFSDSEKARIKNLIIANKNDIVYVPKFVLERISTFINIDRMAKSYWNEDGKVFDAIRGKTKTTGVYKTLSKRGYLKHVKKKKNRSHENWFLLLPKYYDVIEPLLAIYYGVYETISFSFESEKLKSEYTIPLTSVALEPWARMVQLDLDELCDNG
jgi:hypothetical protein